MGRAGNVIGGGDWQNRIVIDKFLGGGIEIRSPGLQDHACILEPLVGIFILVRAYKNKSLRDEAFNFVKVGQKSNCKGIN